MNEIEWDERQFHDVVNCHILSRRPHNDATNKNFKLSTLKICLEKTLKTRNTGPRGPSIAPLELPQGNQWKH